MLAVSKAWKIRLSGYHAAMPKQTLELKPTHKAVLAYYEALKKYADVGAKHEAAVRLAFHHLLESAARQFDWTLVPEFPLKRKHERPLKADGALVDSFHLNHGLWEAKDSDDDLDKEIKAKFDVGYPAENILFQAPARAVLYQNGELVLDADLTKPEKLVEVLRLFLEFAPPAIADWEKAVDEFKDKVPELAAGLSKLLAEQRQINPKFTAAFNDFFALCKASLNPNLAENAVEEMLIQHLLTERIFRKVFDVGDFMQRNVIAAEIEKVIAALTSRHFSRNQFLKSLDRFYGAIENAAATIKDFSQKQTFLNTVYERFFQGFCVKVADTHGIVYTPQPLVDFMVSSVEHVLQRDFSTTLGNRNVHIIDPFTGTGNFIVNLIRRIKKFSLPHKFSTELHCNEIMLLPYYVASMNIEHAFFEQTGNYAPFEGICLVDTFETAEGKYVGGLEMFNEQNYARVIRQKKADIKVIIANPPYNAGQANENDNNKNRKYHTLDQRVRESYGKDSEATLVRKLSDPYVKAIRYASDRIGDTGIVCYVNNNSFIAEKTFDGMRKHLAGDFDLIYILDLGGNARKHPDLSGTTHNVFGIQVGVSINLFIRLSNKKKVGFKKARIFYHAVPVRWRREQKYAFLDAKEHIAGIQWKRLTPDKRSNWITNKNDDEFAAFLPLGTKDAKKKGGAGISTIFRTYSLGVSTNRDAVVYDFDADKLAKRVEQFADDYNAELHRWKTKGRPKDIDNFVRYEKIKWSRNLKRWLRRQTQLNFNKQEIRESLYRPFTKTNLYFGKIFSDELGSLDEMLPIKQIEKDNRLIIVPSGGNRSPFWCFCTNQIPNLNFVSIDSGQCFPFYTYSANGHERHSNIKLAAEVAFCEHYGDDKITKLDIFHYAYGLLHHPEYRARFAENLKRELPRLPFAKDFHAFAKAGKKLADLHVNYEDQKEYPLKHIENNDAPLDWRVEAMKLTNERRSLFYNDYLTLDGIPPEVFDYQLGNRSALEWIIDQYRVTRDESGKIISDPNRGDNEEYIVRLIGQVINVSLETLKTVAALPALSY